MLNAIINIAIIIYSNLSEDLFAKKCFYTNLVLMSIEFFIGLIALSGVIGIHEFGHYIFARICNVGVEVFSIGMGKILWSRMDSHGTKWQICAIPLGGYIIPKEDGDAVGLKFKEAGVIKGVLVAMAGPLFNFITAFICLLFISLNSGFPQFKPEIKEIKKDSPAYISKLQKGDRILSINGMSVKDREDIIFAVQDPSFLIERDNKKIKIIVKKEKKASYGITFDTHFEKTNLQNAIKLSFFTVIGGVYDLFTRIWQSINSFGVVGPIGIIKSAMSAQKDGFISFMLFIASISIALGATNLLPIPALDGGRIVLFILSGIIRRPLPLIIEKTLNYLSIGLLGAMFLISVFFDIKGLLL